MHSPCTKLGVWIAASMVFVSCRSHNAAPPPGPPQPAPPATSAPVTSIQPTALPPKDFRTEDEKNTVDVFQRCAASAVFVTQKQIVVDWWAGKATEVPSGAGTGFVWDDQGHIVTNFHVTLDARSLTVTLQDQKVYPATVVGTEPRKDIAVLSIKISKGALKPITLPPAEYKLEVGQKVIAIGNPFGLDHTLTTGIVSALGRQVDGIGGVTIRDMVQTDAAINPGNSGGPLLDSAGRLIGMNTMIFSKSGASAGIGFAVPARTIARVVPQIIANGHPTRLGLGVRIDPLGRLERRNRIKGVVVLEVADGTAAARAGLQGIRQTVGGLVLGDVIVGIDDTKIDDYDDFFNAVDAHKPGDKV